LFVTALTYRSEGISRLFERFLIKEYTSSMALSATARWILTALVSMGLQLCCCNIENLLGAGCSDHPTGGSDQVLAASIAHHEHNDHSHCNGNHHADSSAPDHHSSSPCGPWDQHDDGECACGAHDKAANLLQQSALDGPLTVVAILPIPTVLISSFTVSAPQHGDMHAVLPPPTSLLRQHCALIV
jgi:hypothetical protein